MSKADIKVQLLDLPEWKRNQEGAGGGGSVCVWGGWVGRPFWESCLDYVAPVNHKNAKYKHDDLIIPSHINAYLMNIKTLYRYI